MKKVLSIGGQNRAEIAFILFIYLVLTQFYNAAIPLGKGPDELTHYLYARFIGDHGRIPATPEERGKASIRSYYPPLYHFPVALFMAIAREVSLPEGETALFPPLKVTWEPATRRLIDIGLPRATLVRTEDERPPYRGEYLAWMVGRWVSTVLSAGTTLLTYLTVRVLLPHRPRFALLAAALLACIPAFLFISSVLNDDNMVGLTAAGYLCLLAWFLRGKEGLWLYLGMGFLIGLTVTAKYNGGLMVLSAALAISLARTERGWRWRDVAWRVGVVGLAAMLSASWWFIWAEVYFNEVKEYGFLLGILKPFVADSGTDVGSNRLLSFFSASVPDPGLPTSGVSGNFGDWLTRIFETTWALTVFGVPVYPVYWPLITFLAFLTLLSGVGLWLTWQRSDSFQKRWMLVFLVHFMLMLPLPLARFFLTYRISDTAQGRHIFHPAAPALLALLLAGWDYWLKPPYQKWVAGLGVGLLFAWALFHGWYLWQAYPPPLPVRTTPGPQVTVAEPTSVVFRDFPLNGSDKSDILALTGYEVWLDPQASTLKLSLRWQSLAQAAEDYRMEITLVDAEGKPHVRWIGHPVEGRFPVRAWEPGDTVRDTLFIPLAGLLAGEYQIQLRLLGWNAPLLNEPLVITSVRLAQDANDSGRQATLWEKGQPVTGSPVYRYRATIPVTTSEPAPLKLVGPDGQARLPLAHSGCLYLFMVDYDWPSGQYRLEGADTPVSLQVKNFDWNFRLPEMSHVVKANFNNQAMLLGYDLPSRRVLPGQGLPLVLYWQALAPMRYDYKIFDHLVDNQQRKWGGYDRLPKEVYSTFLWVPGEVIVDGFAIPVEANAPPGVYQINLGLYLEQQGQAVPLPLVPQGNTTSVSIGPIKVGGPPPGVILSPQEVIPQAPLSVSLGEPPVILLRGYNLTQKPDRLQLTLYWESLAQTSVNWTTFIHLRTEAGETVAQKDGPTGDDPSGYFTSLWDTGEILADETEVPLPAEVAAGEYQLVVGLYDLANGQRLAIPGSPGNEIVLTKLELNRP